MRLIIWAAVGLIAIASADAARAASVQSRCTGYARALTTHVAPRAAMGTPQYRAVYIPTYEECVRRGGSERMPNGLVSAPYFRPGSNPPPASRPTPTPGPQPSPPSPGPQQPASGQLTPQQIAAAQREVEQTLPPGMNYAAAVDAAIAGCGALAVQQADASATSDPQWQQVASSTVANCIAQGGYINGRFIGSRHLTLALHMAKYKSAPSGAPASSNIPGSHACTPLQSDPHLSSCVNDRGSWYVCNQSFCWFAYVVWVQRDGAGQLQPNWPTQAFFNCPGGSCLRPTVGGPRRSPDPSENLFAERRSATVAAISEQCAGQAAGGPAHACAMSICVRNFSPPLSGSQLAQACTALTQSTVGSTTFDYIRAVVGVDGEVAQAFAAIADARLAQGLERTAQQLSALPLGNEPWARPAGAVTVLDASMPYHSVWLSVSQFTWDLRHLPCRNDAALCDGGTVANGVALGSGAVYFQLGQWCRARVGDVMHGSAALSLSPAETSALTEAAVRQCIARAPEDNAVRALFGLMVRRCVGGGGSGGAVDIRDWTGRAASCIATLPQQFPATGVYPMRVAAGTAAGALDYVLRNCSVLAGARWRGGSAEPLAQSVPISEFARRVQGCVQEQIATVQLKR